MSENMVDAIDVTSINAPFRVIGWGDSNLNDVETTTVPPRRIRESFFSVEEKVVDIKELSDHKQKGIAMKCQIV